MNSPSKPTLEAHGLPDSFNLRDFEQREEERLSTAREVRVAVALSVAVFFGLSFWVDQESFVGGVFVGGMIYAFTTWIASYLPIGAILALKDGDLRYRCKVEHLRQALAEWKYYHETTGRGFWQQLRGQSLEHGVAKLFRQRGWDVSMTAITGDGGIDLVLRHANSEIWCQCKGYAKPVSVAAVREIAGVCSAAYARPMLVVVNGITKPALIEAEKLSVDVWDSDELASFARGEFQS